MRKNLGAKPYLYPMPVLIVGTYDKDGVPNAMNAAWGCIADYKQIAMYLARELTDLSLPRLGEVFGRDHSTVLHGWRTISNRMAEESDLRTELADMREELIGH